MSSINLLPKELIEEYEASKKNRLLLNVFLFSLFVISLTVFIIFSATFYLNKKLDRIDRNIQSKEEAIKRFGSLESDTRAMDGRIKSMKKILDSQRHFSKALDQIGASTPSKIYIMEVASDNKASGRGKIVGFAENKEEVSKFVDSLEQSKIFKAVDIESSAVSTDTFLNRDLDNFTLSFTLDLEEMK